MNRSTVRQALLFLLIGGLSALIDAGVFWVLHTLGLVAWLASAISFLSAFAVNYNGNRKVVFRARHSGGALWRYTALVLINLVLSSAGVGGLVALGTDALIAKLITMIAVAIVNFVAMRLWVFRTPGPDPESPDPEDLTGSPRRDGLGEQSP